MTEYLSSKKIKSIYKIILFYVSFIITFLFFPIIFFLIKSIDLFFRVRITEIATNRYGHLTLNPEIYLLEKKEEEKNIKYLDFFYESKYGVCNNEVLNLWKKKNINFSKIYLGTNRYNVI